MKIYIFILCFCLGKVAFSQNVTTVDLRQESLNAQTFYGVDLFENTFYGNHNVLYKKAPNKTYQYSNLALGNITSVSLSNPLEIVVFYKDFNTVVLLDNTLNEIQKISFLNKNVSLVAKAGKNQLWVYDADAQQLELYNYQTKTILSKTQAQSILNPLELKGNTNSAWIKTQSNQIQVYNTFCNLTNTYNYSTDYFTVLNQQELLFSTDNDVFLLNTDLQAVPLDQTIKVLGLSAANNNIYIFNGNTLFIYQLVKN